MQKEELESILSLDNKPFLNDIEIDELLKSLDIIILKNFDKIPNEVSDIYKKFQPMKQNAPDSMKSVLFNTIKNYAIDEGNKGNIVAEILLFRFLLVKSTPSSTDYLHIANAIYKLGYDANKFIKFYEKKEENKLLVYIELSNFYKSTGDLKNAIKYYEKFLEIDKTKSVIYNITADLYSKEYPTSSVERQIELYEQAYKIQPDNRLTLHGLAFNYEKLEQNKKADEYYKKLLETNPTENDYYNYGAFLIHSGDFKNGHKYFTHRFLINDNNLRYPLNDNNKKRWDLKSNIKGKSLLIHYEQGFGDTIMYSRFVPYMKKFTKKIIFAVQEELFDLINNSKIFDNIKVVSNKSSLPEYDFSMALLDCPYVLEVETKTIPYSESYLDVCTLHVEKFKEKFIKCSTKYKIGISVSGAPDANYNDRNLDIENLKFLANNKKFELYSLEKDTDNIPNWLTPLSKNFKNFTDTACAIKNMNLIISTDNVILNLSGAIGVKTIGLFNKETNYRWYKTDGNNVGWYNSVKPLKNNTQNNWAETLMQLNNLVSMYIK